MAAVKTNERPGVSARASHVRGSAYKVRAVLDLIRGKSCAEAYEILAFSERDAAHDITKVLESAVANAEHNEGLDGDELFVSACYADEGPTLNRWRPRARGRATRIRKRTCHITVIVSQYGAERLDELRARRSRLGAQPSEARRRRVAGSRAAERSQESEPEVGPEPGSEPDVDVGARAASVVQATTEALEAAEAAGVEDAEAGADAEDPDEAGAEAVADAEGASTESAESSGGSPVEASDEARGGS